MKDLIVEQNPHWIKTPESYIKRESFQKLVTFLPLRQVITITGIRRCGKSTLAKMAIRHLIDNEVAPGNILFINLEQPLFLEYRKDPNYLPLKAKKASPVRAWDEFASCAARFIYRI